MFRKAVLTTGVLCVAALCFALHTTCSAGGIWISGVTVKNGNTLVFSDDFSKGPASGWLLGQNSSIIKRQGNPPGYLLCLDQRGDCCTNASHAVMINDPAAVEFSAMVFLPPTKDQGNYSTNCTAFTGLILYSGGSEDNIAADVALRPGEKGYRIKLHWNDYSTPDKASNGDVSTPWPVLAAEKWTLLTLRLDPVTRTATALLNGKAALQASYNQERYPSINKIAVWGWLGSDPSKWSK